MNEMLQSIINNYPIPCCLAKNEADSGYLFEIYNIGFEKIIQKFKCNDLINLLRPADNFEKLILNKINECSSHIDSILTYHSGNLIYYYRFCASWPEINNTNKKIFFSFEDITTKIISENKILAASIFFDSFGNPLLIANRAGNKYRVLEVNKAFHLNFGYTDNELNDKILDSLCLWKNFEPLKKVLTVLDERQETFLKDIIIEVILKSGKNIKAGLIINSVKDPDGRVSRLIIMLSDITLRIDYQRQINQKNAELAQNYKLIKNITNTITHKFSNYLTPVSTYSNLWLDRIGSGNINKNDLYKTFDSIRKILDDLNEFIGSTFKLSQFDMKIFDVHALNISEIIVKSSKFLEDMLNRKNLKIINNVPENFIVYGNNFLIKEVIENLLVNACKYSFDNTEIICYAKKKKNSSISFYFENKCESMPRRFRNLIFKPYFRLSNSEPGEGLGLAICQAIIKRHNGKIGVIPKNNNSNIFYFTLSSNEWTINIEGGDDE